jgi:prolipoprotein diacylglyceryl transferase
MILFSIPSPDSSSITIGPLELRAYGLMIALGVLAAVELARRRFAQRGLDPDDMSAIALWAVPAGLIGSRIYHVITDWRRFAEEDGWLEAFRIWNGGLGIPGGVIAGVVVGILVARHRGVPVAEAMDAAIPGVPLAQAIGRLGNWFNQELFGEPTTLPWALEIDPGRRPEGYREFETFHPTFAYEALWNLALVGVLIWIDNRRVLKPGRLIAVYVAGYALGRLWVELLRIDPASLILGVRVNVWMSIIAFTGAVAVLVFSGRREPDDEAAADAADEGDESETPSADDDPTTSEGDGQPGSGDEGADVTAAESEPES